MKGREERKLMALANVRIQESIQPEYAGPVRVAIEFVTPEMARGWLARNDHNRNEKIIELAAIARDILADRFSLNGETIKESISGRLLDGQNRCKAIVTADRGVWSVVVRGLPDKAQETVDIGAKRTLGDILKIRGEVNSNMLAAALSVAWRLENNGHLHSGAGVPAPSDEELLNYLEVHPGIRNSAEQATRDRHSVIRYPGSTQAALHFLMSERDPEAAHEFWTLLHDGSGMYSGNPVLTLRTYLIRDLSALRRMDVKFRAAITIKAWNSFRDGKTLQVIRWRRGGDKPEDFPPIR